MFGSKKEKSADEELCGRIMAFPICFVYFPRGTMFCVDGLQPPIIMVHRSITDGTAQKKKKPTSININSCNCNSHD